MVSMVSVVFDESGILKRASAVGVDTQRIRDNIRAQEAAGVLKRNEDGTLEVVPVHKRKTRLSFDQ